MTAQSYLEQIRLLDMKITEGMEEMEQLKALATRVTSALDGEAVSSSKNPDKMTDVVNKIIKLQEDINRDVDKYVDKKREANELLSQVENPVSFKILHGRYVLYKTWEQIADEINYSIPAADIESEDINNEIDRG